MIALNSLKLPNTLSTSPLAARATMGLEASSGDAIDFSAAGVPPVGDWAALAMAHNGLAAEALPAQAYVWGAGGFGRSLATRLRAAGVLILGFIDRSPELRHGTVQGAPCFAPEEFLGFERKPVLIGVHNFAADLRAIYASLRAAGFDVWNPSRVWRAAGAQNLGWPDAFWLNFPFWGHEELPVALDRARQAFELLGDQASQSVFWGELCARALGMEHLRAASEPGQYAPKSLPRWPEPVRLIDAGAFNGDTLRFFAKEGIRMGQVACFEPDLGNFAALASTLPEGLDAICLPLGVSDTAKTLRFRFDGAASSRQSEGGEAIVQCVGLDQALPKFAPTLVKMDIEGAELDALNGARALIAEFQPALAVSAYHTPDHLWNVLLLLHELAPDHTLHLRAHAHNGFDTVAYALPRG